MDVRGSMATKAKVQGKPAAEPAQNSRTSPVESIVPPQPADEQLRTTVFEIFRRWGYLQASLDPLQQYLPPEPFPVDLPEGSDAIAAEARAFYCGTIALEFTLGDQAP